VYGQEHAHAFETFAALREREYQERAKAAQDIRAVSAQARAAQGAAKLQALEAGTGGPSVSLLMDQFERSRLMSVGIVQGNLEGVSQQLKNQAREATFIMRPQRSIGPLDSSLGLLASGLAVGSAGLGAHQAYPTAPQA